MARRLLGALAILAVLLGCGDLKDLATFAAGVQREFHLPVNVTLSNRSHLRLTFQNVPADRLKDSASRSDFAYSVARFAKAHYPKADSLSDVTIAFMSRTAVGPVSVTRTDAPYVFALRDIK